MSDDQLLERYSQPTEYNALSQKQLSLLHTQGIKIFNEYAEYLAQKADYHKDFTDLLEDLSQKSIEDIRAGIISIYGFRDRELERIDNEFFTECLALALEDHQGWTTQYTQNLLQPLMECSNILELLFEMKSLLSDGIAFYQNNTKQLSDNERTLRQLQIRQFGGRSSPSGLKLSLQSNGLIFFYKHTFKENADFIAEFSSFIKQIDQLLTRLQNLAAPKSKKSVPKKKGKKKGGAQKHKKKAVTPKKKSPPAQQAGQAETAVEVEIERPEMSNVVDKPAITNTPADESVSDLVDISIDPQKLIESWIGELVNGKLSIENYHMHLHQLYADEKAKTAAQPMTYHNDNNAPAPELQLATMAIAKEHLETMSGIFSYSPKIKWRNLVTMVTSENGLKGSVTSNEGGSAATIRFPHPFKENAHVQFSLHSPHPRPELYDALCKRFIRALGRYGLDLASFSPK